MEYQAARNSPLPDSGGKWSDFVAMKKFYSGPTKRCRSEPCLSAERSGIKGDVDNTALSLSWRLAIKVPDEGSAKCPERDIASDQPKSAAGRGTGGGSSSAGKPRKTHRRSAAKRSGPRSRVGTTPLVPMELPKVMVMDAKAGMMGSGRDEPGDRAKHDHSHYHEQHVAREVPAKQWQELLSLQSPPSATPTTTSSTTPRARDVHGAQWKWKHRVPLCHRPTIIMSPNRHAAKQYQDQAQYQLQLEQWQQYEQWQQWQQQQQQQQQQPYAYQYQSQSQSQYHNQYPYQYAQYSQYPCGSQQHQSRVPQWESGQGPVYSVPMESKHRLLKKGRRYCGNFYYK
ncbi:hypothetical protein KR222_004753 [Zaprionus bogoriensis]|nr:hypothetical protein KR222_004753 [Zaprionus bogoriensis]